MRPTETGSSIYSTSKTASTVPNTTRSPDFSGVGPLTRRPLTWTPLVEPRSETVHWPPDSGPQLGVAARHVRVAQDDVAFAAAPDHRAAGRDHEAPPLGLQDRAARAIGARLGQRLLRALGRRVDHRVAVVGLLGRLGLVPIHAHEPRLDAELAEVQPIVGAELDHRSRDEREALAARMLEQVGAQLVDHLVLDAFVALAVLGRQPDRVLIRDIGA